MSAWPTRSQPKSWRPTELSQAGYDKAIAQFGEQGTVELISTIGYYAMVGIFLKSLRRAAAGRQHAAEINREEHFWLALNH